MLDVFSNESRENESLELGAMMHDVVSLRLVQHTDEQLIVKEL